MDEIMALSIQINKTNSPKIHNEEEIYRFENVQLQYYNSSKKKIIDLSTVITSHRIKIFHTTNNVFNFEINYFQIDKYESCSKGFFGKTLYKLKIEMKSGDVYELKHAERDCFKKEYNIFHQEYTKEKWKQTKMYGHSEINKRDEDTGAIKSIVNKERRNLKEKEIRTGAYMRSFDGIFDYFEELKDLFAYFKKSDLKNNTPENQEIKKIVADLGNYTLISKKDSAADEFHNRLAKEIANFLIKYIKSHHGIISVIEAFTLYNSEFRGIDLITAADFLIACELLQYQTKELVFEELFNGIKIIRLYNFVTINYFNQNFGNLYSDEGYLTQEDISYSKKISINLARIMLDLYLREGFLCIDDHVSGRFYYPNEFEIE